MTASVSSPADVLNLALRRLGYRLRVGSLYEGSFAAKQALDIYAQTRDEVLAQNDWGFVERNVQMTLLKSAPPGGYVPPLTWSSQYPPLPWLYEFAYPSDSLKVRAVKTVPIFVPNFDPKPQLYSLDNDNALNPPQKVILTNINPCILVYVGQVTDPSQWEVDLVDAVAAALARRLAPVLANLDTEKLEAGDELASKAIAEQTRG